MKVAFISYDWGEYCLRLTGALAQYADVMLILPSQLAAPHLSKLHPEVRFHPFDKPRLRHPLRQLWTIYRNLQTIRDFQPDVIHVQQGHLWFNLALPLLRNFPLVVTIHDPRFHLGDKESQKTPQVVADFGFHRAQHIIVHAEQIKQDVMNYLSIPDEKIDVIPHIVLGDDQSDFEEEENHILFFGRIWEYKGLEYLIRAEPIISEHCPDVHIVIAGKGDDFDKYRLMMIHPEKFIVYNEYVSNEKRAELFQRASVVVLPYIDASQSGVIPFAYTYAKPVVATTVGGLPEMVDDGKTGYLVPPRDEQALAEAVICLLKNTDQRRAMGANGKRKLDAECSPEAVAQKTFNVYRSVIDTATQL